MCAFCIFFKFYEILFVSHILYEKVISIKFIIVITIIIIIIIIIKETSARRIPGDSIKRQPNHETRQTNSEERPADFTRQRFLQLWSFSSKCRH